MKILICKKCGESRELGRKLCRSCNLERLLESRVGKPRYMYDKACTACNTNFQAWRKTQELCGSCNTLKIKMSGENKTVNQYVAYRGITKSSTKFRHVHRFLAEQITGRQLHTNEVVHHMDDNPKNNALNNLLVLDRRSHGKLHKYLDVQRVIIEKSMNENSENCWNTLIVPMTTAWLEIAGVKVIKLWEIGQPAAEPLKEKSQEEGSETMHGTFVTGKAVEDDIVQTTTGKTG